MQPRSFPFAAVILDLQNFSVTFRSLVANPNDSRFPTTAVQQTVPKRKQSAPRVVVVSPRQMVAVIQSVFRLGYLKNCCKLGVCSITPPKRQADSTANL